MLKLRKLYLVTSPEILCACGTDCIEICSPILVTVTVVLVTRSLNITTLLVNWKRSRLGHYGFATRKFAERFVDGIGRPKHYGIGYGCGRGQVVVVVVVLFVGDQSQFLTGVRRSENGSGKGILFQSTKLGIWGQTHSGTSNSLFFVGVFFRKIFVFEPDFLLSSPGSTRRIR